MSVLATDKNFRVLLLAETRSSLEISTHIFKQLRQLPDTMKTRTVISPDVRAEISSGWHPEEEVQGVFPPFRACASGGSGLSCRAVRI
jgi:hypothetical protein